MEELQDVCGGEGLEGVDAAAGEEGGVELEGGVFCGGADEADGAALDVGEEGVLLGFVEAVDFIDEEDGSTESAGWMGGRWEARSASAMTALISFMPERTAENSMKEALVRCGDDFGEGGFADAGWAPEDDGGGCLAGLDGEAEGLAGGEEVLLAGVVGEGAGAHALGEWGLGLGGLR